MALRETSHILFLALVFALVSQPQRFPGTHTAVSGLGVYVILSTREGHFFPLDLIQQKLTQQCKAIILQ